RRLVADRPDGPRRAAHPPRSRTISARDARDAREAQARIRGIGASRRGRVGPEAHLFRGGPVPSTVRGAGRLRAWKEASMRRNLLGAMLALGLVVVGARGVIAGTA